MVGAAVNLIREWNAARRRGIPPSEHGSMNARLVTRALFALAWLGCASASEPARGKHARPESAVATPGISARCDSEARSPTAVSVLPDAPPMPSDPEDPARKVFSAVRWSYDQGLEANRVGDFAAAARLFHQVTDMLGIVDRSDGTAPSASQSLFPLSVARSC